MTSAFSISEAELSRFLGSVVLLLLGTQVLGRLAKRFSLPQVVGEIGAGLVLGPSLLGSQAPQIYASIFTSFPAQGTLLAGVAWLGMVLLMFQAGMDAGELKGPSDRRLVLGIVLAGTILPLGSGLAFSQFADLSAYLGPSQNIEALQLIIAMTFIVTSIPVLARIFREQDMHQSRFAGIVLSSATVVDIFVWALLGIATGLSTNHMVWTEILSTVGISLLAFILVFLGLPLYLAKRTVPSWLIKVAPALTTTIVLICLGFSAAASLFGIHIVLGAFLGGTTLRLLTAGKVYWQQPKATLQDFSSAFFVPLYFGMVGMKVDLSQGFAWGVFITILLCSSLVKFVTVGLATRCLGQTYLSALNFAIAMNTRGGPCILIASVALSLGIIDGRLYAVLIAIALGTSILSGWWFTFLRRSNMPLLAEDCP